MAVPVGLKDERKKRLCSLSGVRAGRPLESFTDTELESISRIEFRLEEMRERKSREYELQMELQFEERFRKEQAQRQALIAEERRQRAARDSEVEAQFAREEEAKSREREAITLGRRILFSGVFAQMLSLCVFSYSKQAVEQWAFFVYFSGLHTLPRRRPHLPVEQCR
jgi:hypothetical protein